MSGLESPFTNLESQSSIGCRPLNRAYSTNDPLETGFLGTNTYDHIEEHRRAADRVDAMPVASADRSRLLKSAYGFEQLPDDADAISHRRDMPAQPSIETEAAPGGMDREHEHHDC